MCIVHCALNLSSSVGKCDHPLCAERKSSTYTLFGSTARTVFCFTSTHISPNFIVKHLTRYWNETWMLLTAYGYYIYISQIYFRHLLNDQEVIPSQDVLLFVKKTDVILSVFC